MKPVNRINITSRMIALSHVAERIADQHLFRQFDLTGATGGVLLIVNKYPTTTPTDLMKRFGCTRSNVTQRIDKLELMKLIKRGAGPSSDKRSISLALTPKGKKIADELWTKVEARGKEVENVLKPAEMKRFHASLDRIEKFLKDSEHRAW